MNKKTLTASAALVLASAGALSAQTQDISVIVAPTAGYTSFHKNLNLGESPSAGVRAGFAVGPLFEVRGLWDRSFNVKQIENISSTKIERLGGELKLNLWSNMILTPYVTAGAGVMKMKYDDAAVSKNYEEKQLYTALGAGLKINLTKRVALALEAKDYIFNVDHNNRYLKAGVDGNKALHNFGGQASLDFYLGGNLRSKDKVTRAFRNTFGNGFRGAKFVLEPGMAYLDFNESSLFNDTYLLGGSAGIDFGQYLGLRGFYYQGTKNPNKLDLNFGKELEMYGGNVIARLNVSRGVTPYLSLGAGYLNVKNDYTDAKGGHDAKKGWFALGGGGLEVPLHRTVALYGEANVMLNEQDNKDVSTITNPADVKTNWMFKAGLRFNLGAKSRNGERLYRNYANDLVEAEREDSNNKLNQLRRERQATIDSLQQKLDEALEAQDFASVKVLADSIDQKQADVKVITEEENNPTEENVTVLTKAQLEELVNRISAKKRTNEPTSQLSELERLLLILNLRGTNVAPTVYAQPTTVAPHVITTEKTQTVTDAGQQPMVINAADAQANEAKIMQRIEDMERRINRRIDNAQQQPSTTTILTAGATDSYSSGNFLKFQELSVLGGFGVGPALSLHAGLRPTWQMGNSRFSFAPDAFYIRSKENGYSVSANLLYTFGTLKSARLTPYIGAGLGYSNYAYSSRGGVSLIGGVKFQNIFGGNLFVDLSLRPAFSNAFISAGYSIKF